MVKFFVYFFPDEKNIKWTWNKTFKWYFVHLVRVRSHLTTTIHILVIRNGFGTYFWWQKEIGSMVANETINTRRQKNNVVIAQCERALTVVILRSRNSQQPLVAISSPVSVRPGDMTCPGSATVNARMWYWPSFNFINRPIHTVGFVDAYNVTAALVPKPCHFWILNPFIGVFSKWSRTFIEFSEFRESEKSLRCKLGSV